MTPNAPHRARLNALEPWQGRFVIGSGVSLLASGLAWLPVHYLWGAGAGELPHPLEPWLVRWHGVSAVFGTFALGLVAAGHVSRGWRAGVKRGTGLAMCVLAGLLVASGCLLAYLVPETVRSALGLLHTGLGVLAFGLGAIHRK
jgi:hypothetical protein